MQKSINSGSVIISDHIRLFLLRSYLIVLELLKNTSKVSKDVSCL